MLYRVRLVYHIYLDIYLDIHLNAYLNVHLNAYLDLYLTLHPPHLTSPLRRSTPPNPQIDT